MISILIVKPSSLGDIVHTLPAVHFLKSTFPESAIRWIANSEWVPILEGNPDLEGIISFPRREFRGAAGLFKFIRWSSRLSALEPDIVLDFQGLLRSAWLSHRSNGKRILGLSDAREGAQYFYQGAATAHKGEHSVDRYLSLAKLAGAAVAGRVEFPLPVGRSPDQFELPAQAILLHPFARGSGKSLSAQEISDLTRFLAPRPVVFVGKSDQEVPRESNAVSLVNKTDLSQLIWLIRKASFVISVDSGPMHIAAAITSKLLSIHIWSDPKRVGPYNPEAWVWKNGQILKVRSISDKDSAIITHERPDPLQLATFIHESMRP
jgi:ADP-heptose:LPS heptosyltransferase